MKSCFKIFLLLLPVLSSAQDEQPANFRKIFLNSRDDSTLYEAATHLYSYYEEVNRDSAFFYADQCVQISQKNNKKI